MSAVQRSTLGKQQPMKKLIEKKYQTDDDCATGYLWAAYRIAKRELPKEEFEYSLELLEMAGKDLKRSSNKEYCSSDSITDFQNALAETILEEKLNDLKSSPVYSVIIDESTDMGNRKRLLVYGQYLCKKMVDVIDGDIISQIEMNQIDMCLLNNIEITECKASADVIASKVVVELKDKGIEMSKLIGIGTDGASVMTGRKNGVIKRLQDQCPSLVGVHCAAHRCALAASQATKDIPEMEWYSRVVTNVFRFFSNSALRENKLRDIQELLEQPQLKYADIHSVRWLSMENAVCILYRTYPALCMTLSDMAANGDIVAKSHYNDVSQYKFIAFTHMLMDILPFIGRLSKVFQGEQLDFSKVMPMVESTCESLKDMLECEGVFMDKLNTFVNKPEEATKAIYSRPISESSSKAVRENKEENVDFKGFAESDIDGCDGDNDKSECEVRDVDLQYYVQQSQMIPRVMEKYINAVVENLEDRFAQKDLISAMDCLIPENIIKQNTISAFGSEEIEKLAEHFEKQLDIDTDKCKNEYKQYKRLVAGSYRKKTILEMTDVIGEKYAEEMPNLLKILQSCVTIPMNTAKCERGFSTQNRIKTKLRTRLNNQSLVDLMRISEDGPPLKDFNFPRALVKWKTAKVRKLYSK